MGKNECQKGLAGQLQPGRGGCDVEGGGSGQAGILALVQTRETVGGYCRLSPPGRQGPSSVREVSAGWQE